MIVKWHIQSWFFNFSKYCVYNFFFFPFFIKVNNFFIYIYLKKDEVKISNFWER